MTHTPSDPVDRDVAEEESLKNTDVRGDLDKDPETQQNRKDAPDPEDLPSPPLRNDTTRP